MVKRIDVALEQTEYSALLEMANDDLRNPSDQLRHILRLEIERRLDNKGNNETTKQTKKKNMQERKMNYQIRKHVN